MIRLFIDPAKMAIPHKKTVFRTIETTNDITRPSIESKSQASGQEGHGSADFSRFAESVQQKLLKIVSVVGFDKSAFSEDSMCSKKFAAGSTFRTGHNLSISIWATYGLITEGVLLLCVENMGTEPPGSAKTILSVVLSNALLHFTLLIRLPAWSLRSEQKSLRIC